MKTDKSWIPQLEQAAEPENRKQAALCAVWKIAMGLQDVDGLAPSSFLLEIASAQIRGKFNLSEAEQKLTRHYSHPEEESKDAKEADLSAIHIVKLLGDNQFAFAPGELVKIHKGLFSGVFDHAGKIRKYNITKDEWVLGGDTVTYGDADLIRRELIEAFESESRFSYEGLSPQDTVRHLAAFAARIWKTHPFGEGNTRTTSVFLIKYLGSLGFSVYPNAFAESSWYLRNAMVRANYENAPMGIYPTTEYLELFLDNLIYGTHHELKNRYLYVDTEQAFQIAPTGRSSRKKLKFRFIFGRK